MSQSHAALGAQVHQINRDKEALDQQLGQLDQQRSQLGQERASLREQLDGALATVQNLTTTVQNLTKENAAAQNRLQSLDNELEAARDEVARAAALEEEVRHELEAANRELEQLLGVRTALVPNSPGASSAVSGELLENVASALRAHGAAMKALEFRIGSMEQRNAQLAGSVSGILESKIWRTLVRGGGFLQRLTGK